MKKAMLNVVVLMCCTVSAWAIPTALIQIPIADVSAPGEGFVDVTGVLDTDLDTALEDWFFDTNFGLPGGLEVGFDTPLNGLNQGAFFIKKQVTSAIDSVAIAVGVNGIGFNGDAWNPYVVASTSTGRSSWHVGATYLAEDWSGMLGLTYVQSDRLTWVADVITGHGNASSYGCNWTFGPGQEWFLLSGFIRATGDGGDSVYVQCGRSITFQY